MAIIGGFINRKTHFPGSYYGGMFYGDYVLGRISFLPLDAAGNPSNSSFVFDDAAGGVINIQQGADGSIWYSAIGGLVRIFYVGSGNQPPIITQVGETKRVLY